jgi:alkylation response protein AidB-like acyl-CoA dehydrogenase
VSADADQHPTDERAEVRAALGRLLTARRAGYHARVMGAGSDDFESGRAFLALLDEGGWAVPTWPEEHGGRGTDKAGAALIAEVLAEFETPDMYPFLVGLDLIGPTILTHGTEEQKRRWLPPLKSGEEIWCQMFSEPDAGSDLANLKTRATHDGDSWRISGQKVWTSRGHYAQRALLLTRTDPSVPKHRGITAFGLDMSAPGVTVRPLVQMNRDSHFTEVFLDDVVVSDADRIGDVGDGWRVAITCLSFERGSLAGDMGVTGEDVLGLAADGPAGPRSPAERERILRAYTTQRVIGLNAARAQAARERGRAPGPEGSGAKLNANRMIKEVASLALELQGPAGTLDEAEDRWKTTFLVSPSLSIRGGTDEIQHNIIGERVLGLPPEPRVDKDRPFSERPDQ